MYCKSCSPFTWARRMLFLLLIFLIQCNVISTFRHVRISGYNIQHGQLHHRQGMITASHLPIPATSSDAPKTNFFNRMVSYPSRKIQSVKSFFNTELPMLQYLWPKDNIKLKAYLVLSMVFLFMGKWFNLRVPFVLQSAIDSLSASSSLANNAISSSTFRYICMYGVYRALSVLCTEIKTCLFTHVSQTVLQQFANQIFSHLHSLDSNFHLNNPSGVISVAYVRAIRGLQTLLFQIVFSITPTILELVMVSTVLHRKFGGMFAYITLCTCVCYILYTIFMTEYRVKLRTELVEVDNKRNAYLIDTLVNHEIVKLFTQSGSEQKRYSGILDKLRNLNILSTYNVGGLNVGQGALFSLGLVCSLLVAAHRVKSGKMTMGDVVAVNGLLLQLSVPFNFIGYTYQELRQSLVDMQYMKKILAMQAVRPATSSDSEGVSSALPSIDTLSPRSGPSSVEFRNVFFSYPPQSAPADGSSGEDEPQEKTLQITTDSSTEAAPVPLLPVLHNISFSIQPGQQVAIVGPSGSGKSTTLKLLSGLLQPTQGSILLDHVDTQTVNANSLLERMSVIPQDPSLFDSTLNFNLRYGSGNCSSEEVRQVVQYTGLGSLIERVGGLEGLVGERGGRLSGGERQKVSVARGLLRKPSLLLCDEVTSSVDAISEREIVSILRGKVGWDASAPLLPPRTTLIVAHRLSTIRHCDVILVMQQGRIVERGRHEDLLQVPGGVYRGLWEAQQGEGAGRATSSEYEDAGLEGVGGAVEGLAAADRGALPPSPTSTSPYKDTLYPAGYEESVGDEEERNAYLHYMETQTHKNLRKRYVDVLTVKPRRVQAAAAETKAEDEVR